MSRGGEGGTGRRPGRSDAAAPVCAEGAALVPYGRVPADGCRAAVLTLHGGRPRGVEPPSAWNLPDARMRPFLRSLARSPGGRGLLLARVRYRCRGWNGERADPVQDARRALAALAQAAGPVPVVLVGHSMGGRAALYAGGDERVRGVVALAPWCPEGEPAGHLAGRHVLVVHGDRDRTTDPHASREFAARAAVNGADARHVTVPGGDHRMLRRPAAWHRLVTEEVAAMLGPAAERAAGASAASALKAPWAPSVSEAPEAPEE